MDLQQTVKLIITDGTLQWNKMLHHTLVLREKHHYYFTIRAKYFSVLIYSLHLTRKCNYIAYRFYFH
jgi:hypothetical protein